MQGKNKQGSNRSGSGTDATASSPTSPTLSSGDKAHVSIPPARIDDRHWLENTRDAFQIGFFVVVATVTILTYRKARLTLLQPLRTEVFKEQLKVFSELLPMFVGRGESELRDDFHFDELLSANVFALYDSYALTFFDLKTKIDERPYSTKACPSSRIKIAAMGDKIVLMDGHLQDRPGEQAAGPPDPRTRAARWSLYQHGEIHIPKALTDHEEKLERLMGSPLLPGPLLTLLVEYKTSVDKNISLVGDLLTKAAQEMPEKYPDEASFKKGAFGWIHTRWVREFEDLEPKAKQISEYLRSYFQTDNLLTPG